jgi:hypothetical protein
MPIVPPDLKEPIVFARANLGTLFPPPLPPVSKSSAWARISADAPRSIIALLLLVEITLFALTERPLTLANARLASGMSPELVPIASTRAPSTTVVAKILATPPMVTNTFALAPPPTLVFLSTDATAFAKTDSSEMVLAALLLPLVLLSIFGELDSVPSLPSLRKFLQASVDNTPSSAAAL